MDKKMKLILIGLALAIILFFTTMFFLIWNSNDKDLKDNIDNQEEIDAGQEDPLNDNEEVEKIDLSVVLEESKEHSRVGRYDLALKVIDDKIKSHGIDKYDDYFIIEKHQEDLLNLAQLETQYMNGFLDEALESVKNMNDPENFFIGFLGFSYDYKLYLISSPISLLPPPNPKIGNLEISKLTAKNDVTKDVLLRDNKLESLFAMNITIDGNDLIAYIAKNDNGFYLYELSGDAKFMLTIESWLELKGGEETYE